MLKLTAFINSLSGLKQSLTGLTDKVNSLETDLTEKITSLETELTDKVTSLETGQTQVM
jgi:hypothetical protein